jgi:hypothetical protein
MCQLSFFLDDLWCVSPCPCSLSPRSASFSDPRGGLKSHVSRRGQAPVFHLHSSFVVLVCRSHPLAFTPGAHPLFSCSRCFYVPHSLVSTSAPRVRPAVRPVIRSAAATASSRFLFAVPSIFWAAIGSCEELTRKNLFLSLAPVCHLVLALPLALVIAINYRFQVIRFSVECCR